MKIPHRRENSWGLWLIKIAIGLGLSIASTLWLFPLAYAQRGYRAMGGEVLLVLFLFLLPLCIPTFQK